METRVVTVSVDAEAAGYRLGVTDVDITLGVNAIPKIELTCAPSEYGRHEPLRPNVYRPTISDYSDTYKKLSKLAEGMTKVGYVSISVEDSRDRDSLNLNGWVLTGVGMSSAGASSAPEMVVVLQHPICRLTKVGSIYETAKSDLATRLAKINESEAPFLEVVQRTYEFLGDSSSDNLFWKSPNEYPPAFRHALADMNFSPQSYLRDDTEKYGSTFLSKFVDKDRMAQAEATLILPNDNGTSTWDMLLSMSGHMLTSIVQDQECNFTGNKLVIEPTMPWKPEGVSLGEDWCVSSDLPGMNPFRISGVMARKLGPFSGDVTLGIRRLGNINITESMNSEVMYVPDPLKDPDVMNGRIIKTSSPALLEMAYRQDAPFGKQISTSGIKDKKDRGKEYNDALEAYCKALYEISTLSLSRGTAKMSLYFRDVEHNLILPGNTCRFYTEDRDLYYGYIQKVVHHISTKGNCSTKVVMSHVRPDMDYLINEKTAVQYGSTNAAWE